MNFDQIMINFGMGPEHLFKFQDQIPQFSPLIGNILSPQVLLLAGAIIVFLGVEGEIFFKKTGLPGSIFLFISSKPASKIDASKR